MAFPSWFYQDPSKHADYMRKIREQEEANNIKNKKKKAKENLEKLFKEGK